MRIPRTLTFNGFLAGVFVGAIIQALIWLAIFLSGCSDPPPPDEMPWPTGSTGTSSLTIRPVYTVVASAKPTVVDDFAAYVYDGTKLVASGKFTKTGSEGEITLDVPSNVALRVDLVAREGEAVLWYGTKDGVIGGTTVEITMSWMETSFKEGAINVNNSTTLEWHSVPLAANYQLVDGSGSLVYQGTDTTFTVSSSQNQTIAYTIVTIAPNSYGTSRPSPERTVSFAPTSNLRIRVPWPSDLRGGQSTNQPTPAPSGMVLVPGSPAFWIDETEVTEFAFYGSGSNSLPAGGMSWQQAKDYAASIGKRLPTPAEWEFAARGGLVGMLYPWGNEPDLAKANFSGDVKPVRSYPPNGYGLYNVFGNVWEYVDSPNAIRGYSASNGIGPITFQTTSQADPAIGFRCAKDPD